MSSRNNGKVYFSTKPVPRRDFSRLVDGADAGIAFYVPTATDTYTGQNIEVIGLSSGKLATYLWAGLPVVVNSASTMGALASKEGFGIAVRDATDIGAAVLELTDRYDDFARQARRFFDEQLDFRIGCDRILKRIGEIGV
jgi:hypothetical protein